MKSYCQWCKTNTLDDADGDCAKCGAVGPMHCARCREETDSAWEDSNNEWICENCLTQAESDEIAEFARSMVDD